MSQIREFDNELNQSILSGQILPAFDKHYAEDIVMQENSDEPTSGKAANRKKEEDFVGSIQEFHGAKLLGSAVNGETSYSEWEYDLTFKGGQRVTMSQVSARRWKDGQVSHERFYYNKG